MIYLDNAATTPVRTEVLHAMLPYLSDEAFGNPSSAHSVGRRARAGVEEAKRQIAEALGAEPNQVIFTSGGTEADNLAILGTAHASRARGGSFRVAVTAVEHPAVHEAAEAVETQGGEAVVLPVDANGRVDEAALNAALEKGLALVSAMWVNNEVGTIQDVGMIADAAAEADVPFHTDAVQAVGKIPARFDTAPIDMFALSGHKIGAPQGVGALLVRDRRALEAMVHGGGQQFGVRPGTENVAGIVALGAAVELAVSEREQFERHTGALREEFERELTTRVPDAVVMGGTAPRAPHICNVAIPGIDAEAMLMHLDLAGVACSAGSACHTGNVEPSRVLTALGVPPELASRALRFSFAKATEPADVKTALEILPAMVGKIRALAESLGR